jgi:hypothetical protein
MTNRTHLAILGASIVLVAVGCASTMGDDSPTFTPPTVTVTAPPVAPVEDEQPVVDTYATTLYLLAQVWSESTAGDQQVLCDGYDLLGDDGSWHAFADGASVPFNHAAFTDFFTDVCAGSI